MPSNRNQSLDLQSKLTDWFLYVATLVFNELSKFRQIINNPYRIGTLQHAFYTVLFSWLANLTFIWVYPSRMPAFIYEFLIEPSLTHKLKLRVVITVDKWRRLRIVHFEKKGHSIWPIHQWTCFIVGQQLCWRLQENYSGNKEMSNVNRLT